MDELSKNQSSTTRGELATGAANGFLSAAKNGGTAKDWGAGAGKYAYFLVTSAAAWNPGATGQVQVGVADDSAGTNFVALADSGALAVAGLTAGTYHRIGVLASGTKKQYLMAKWFAAGGNATTGALVVGLTANSGPLASYGDTANSFQ